MNQGTTVAEIALSLTDKPIPTAVEILAALNKAYEAGYAQGVVSGSTHMAKTMELIFGKTP